MNQNSYTKTAFIATSENIPQHFTKGVNIIHDVNDDEWGWFKHIPLVTRIEQGCVITQLMEYRDLNRFKYLWEQLNWKAKLRIWYKFNCPIYKNIYGKWRINLDRIKQ